MKIKVNNNTHEAIQKALFAIGYKWHRHNVYTPGCNETGDTWWIYADDDMTLSYSDYQYGVEHDDEEVMLPKEWRV